MKIHSGTVIEMTGFAAGLVLLLAAFNWLLVPPLRHFQQHRDSAVNVVVASNAITPINIWRPPLTADCISDPEWTVTATTEQGGEAIVDLIDYEITSANDPNCIGRKAGSWRVSYSPKAARSARDVMYVVAGNKQTTLTTYNLEIE